MSLEFMKNKADPNRPWVIAAIITGVLTTVSSILFTTIFMWSTFEIYDKVGSNFDNDNASSLLAAEEPREYTSVEHGFRIDFPGLPDVTRETVPLEGMSIPYTTYVRELSDGSTFMVAIANYPPAIDVSTEEQQATVLEGSVNGSAQSLNGTIVASEFTIFHNLPAVTGLIDGVYEGEQYEYHTLNFLDGSRLFQIVAINVDQARHDNFVNTFELSGWGAN